jgi:hypothetical protein
VKFSDLLLERVLTQKLKNQEWQSVYDRVMVSMVDRDTTYFYRVLYVKEWLWIFVIDKFQYEVFYVEYNSKVAGYIGQNKTFKVINRNFYWAGIDKFIRDYV